MSSPTELEVWMAADRIAILDGADRRNLRLVYDDAWVNRPTATPLSVSMPVAARVHSGRRVASYLWGLLPDNERVLSRWASTHQCSATDVFGLLRGVGADVAGAARYLEPGVGAPEVDRGFTPLDDAEVAALLAEVRVDAAAWHPRNRSRWSLAGAQAKIALAYDEATRSWGIPSGSRPTTHIFKPGIAGLAQHHVNEHLCLSAASSLGLRAAASTVTAFETVRTLVVARYDRIVGGNDVARVHQEDLCQALAVHPQLKYESDGGPGVEAITGLLREVEVTHATADIAVFLRSVAFNWLILGTDAHAKNYSLLLSGTQVRFAPLYDLASAAGDGQHPRKLRMAQRVGGENRPVFIGRRHWERVARSAGIDVDSFVNDITVMAERLPDVLTDCVASAGLVAEEQIVADRLVEGIRDWTARCRAVLEGP